jgi:hypothetical protein
MGMRLVRSNFLLSSHATFLSFFRSESTSATRNSHFDVSWHRRSFSPCCCYYYTPFSYLPASSTSRRGLQGSDAFISLCGVLRFLLSDKLLSIRVSFPFREMCMFLKLVLRHRYDIFNTLLTLMKIPCGSTQYTVRNTESNISRV